MGIVQTVTAALIRDTNGRYLLCQRGKNDKFALKWEFPGGKLEAGETEEECLVREIREELCLDVRVEDHFCDVTYQYPVGVIFLKIFYVEIIGGKMRLMVHNAVEWVKPEDMLKFDLLPADIEIVEKIMASAAEI